MHKIITLSITTILLLAGCGGSNSNTSPTQEKETVITLNAKQQAPVQSPQVNTTNTHVSVPNHIKKPILVTPVVSTLQRLQLPECIYNDYTLPSDINWKLRNSGNFKLINNTIVINKNIRLQEDIYLKATQGGLTKYYCIIIAPKGVIPSKPNQAPTAAPQVVTLDKDTSITIRLSATDPESNVITYKVVTPPSHGTYKDGIYTPTANYFGKDSFTFKANDGEYDSSLGKVSITIKDTPKSIVTVAQAILGPLSDADFKISTLSGSIIAEGKTTQGDGTDVNSAGLIQVTQEIKDALSTGLYIVEVTAGDDIDADDDSIWDTSPTENKGTLHAIIHADDLKKGDFKVNILTEVVYQNIKKSLTTNTPAQIEALLTEKSKVLFKEASSGGDVNGDGAIDGDDLISWNPAEDKSKLAVDYTKTLEPIANKILKGTDIQADSIGVFPTEKWVIDTTEGLVQNEAHEGIYLKTHIYNDQGNLIKTISDFFNYDYDYTKNRASKIIPPSINETTVESYKYEFDKNGNITKKDIFTKYNDYSSHHYSTINEYDENGNLIKESHDGSYFGSVDGKIDYVLTHVYDTSGNLIKTTKKNENSNQIITTYTYDKNGKITEEVKKYSADYSYKTIYTYDESGNLIKKIRVSDSDSPDTITYEYDENGNLIRETYNQDKAFQNTTTWKKIKISPSK